MRNTPFAPRQGPTAARIKPNAKWYSSIYLWTHGRGIIVQNVGKTLPWGCMTRLSRQHMIDVWKNMKNEQRFGGNSKNKKQEDELLDKMTLTSTEVPTQTKYLVGVMHNDELHVTPLKTVIQMRPGFNYLDKIDEKYKAANKRIQDVERQEEKKKMDAQAQTVQVSMKQNDHGVNSRNNLYSMAVRNADQEQWKPVTYYDETTSEAELEYSRLYSSRSVQLRSTMTQSEFLDQISALKV
ncbi:unnamed protein product [Absidia cylindrospora]